MNLTSNNELAEFHDISQFNPGESLQMCGYYAVALCAQSAPPGQSLSLNEQQVHQMAVESYSKYAGPNVRSNENGMTLEELYADLSLHQMAYTPLEPHTSVVLNWLAQGYPVILAVSEASVFDLGLAASPYPWNTAGYNHIIVGTGVKNGNILVRDTANIEAPNSIRQGPRLYASGRLSLLSATLVKPKWKVVPSAIATAHVAIEHIVKVFPMITANDDDKDLWNAVKPGISFDSSHAIPQAWLQALYQNIFLGCPVENERGNVQRGGKSCTEQCFTASVARWQDGACSFYGPTGLLFKH